MFTRRLLLPAVTLLGLVLRLVQLNFQPLWWDEGYSVFFATRDLPTLLARTAVDIHPPLYYILMQWWSDLFGTGDVALRLLSVLIGVATIPLLYLVARDLFDERVGILSAFLLAIAPLPIYYSQELRMYGLVTLLALASVAFQLKLLTHPDTTSASSRATNPILLWLGYILVTALALLTQYFAAFIIAAELVVIFYLKYRARWRLQLNHWLLAWLAIAALYLPWFIYAGPKLYTYVTAKVGIEQYTRLDPLTYLIQHLVAFTTGHLTDWTWLSWGAIVFIILAVLGYLASRRYQVGEGNSQLAIQNSLTAIYLLIPLALGFIVNLLYTFHPVHYERLLLFAAPFLFIYLACGILSLYDREHPVGVLVTAVVVILCALSLFDFYTVARYPDEDYRPLIADMSNLAAPNDLVYAVYPWQIGYLATYYHGARLNLHEVDGDVWIKNSEQMHDELDDLRQNNPRAWIIAYQKQGRIIEDRLTNEYINDYLVYDQTFGNTRLEYFAQGSETDFESMPITFAPDLTLNPQFAAFDSPTAPHLALARFTWNAKSDNYAYSLRVTDSANTKIAQQDASIPNGSTVVRRALALPANLPAGTYTLQLVAYHRADGTALISSTGSPILNLAKFTITP